MIQVFLSGEERISSFHLKFGNVEVPLNGFLAPELVTFIEGSCLTISVN
jgi:hypothetical protein